MTPPLLLMTAALLLSAEAGPDLIGPARFCGHSPIIDLLPGESVTTLDGGIHSGNFKWDGAFGSLTVNGSGWTARPEGRMVKRASGASPAMFEQRRVNDRYEVAIWNGANSAASFRSDAPFTPGQMAAIGRVRLYEEGMAPEGCDLHTTFSWQ